VVYFHRETPEKKLAGGRNRQDETEESIALCEKLFAERLEGNPLISNAKHLRGSAIWLKFNRCCAKNGFTRI